MPRVKKIEPVWPVPSNTPRTTPVRFVKNPDFTEYYMKRRFSIVVPRQNYYHRENNQRVGTGRIVFESERWPTSEDVMRQCQGQLVGSNQVAYRTHNFSAMMDTITENPSVWPADCGEGESSVDVLVNGEETHKLTITVLPIQRMEEPAVAEESQDEELEIIELPKGSTVCIEEDIVLPPESLPVVLDETDSSELELSIEQEV